MSDRTHVYPLNDEFEHDLESNSCWCCPKIECEGQLIVHNSFDGREFFENQGPWMSLEVSEQ